MYITVNDEKMLISTAQALQGVVRPLDFAENCEQCGSNLARSAKVNGEKVVCNCGKDYMIHDITPPAEKSGTNEENPMAKATTKKDDFAPTKKAKKDDFAPTKKAKAEKVEKTERKSRDGSITNTLLVHNEKWDGKIREGSICATIFPFFKTAKKPGDILDKMIAKYNENHKVSGSAKKNPKAYVLWHVLYLFRKQALVKSKG